MSDNRDLAALRDAAEAVQDAIAELPEPAEAEPMPKLRVRRLHIALALPPDLLRTLAEFAAQDRRSRANLIEIILDDYAQARLAQKAA